MSAVDLGELAAKVIGAMPRPDGDGVPLVLMVYRRLAEGAPVRVEALASQAGLSVSRAREVLASCEVATDGNGAIVGFGGLTLTPTAHRFEVDGVTLYTWCSWDALFLPLLLRKPAHVSSSCPVTGQDVHLIVTPSAVESIEPHAAVMSFLPPTCRGAEIISGFCQFVLLFASAQAGEQWTAKHPGTLLLTIHEAFELGGLVNAARYGPLLSPAEQGSPGGPPAQSAGGPSSTALGGLLLAMAVCCLAGTLLAGAGGLAALGAVLRNPVLIAAAALLTLAATGIALRRHRGRSRTLRGRVR